MLAWLQAEAAASALAGGPLAGLVDTHGRERWQRGLDDDGGGKGPTGEAEGADDGRGDADGAAPAGMATAALALARARAGLRAADRGVQAARALLDALQLSAAAGTRATGAQREALREAEQLYGLSGLAAFHAEVGVLGDTIGLWPRGFWVRCLVLSCCPRPVGWRRSSCTGSAA